MKPSGVCHRLTLSEVCNFAFNGYVAIEVGDFAELEPQP